MAKSGLSYKWIAIIVVGTGTFMATLDAGMIRIILPYLSELYQVDANTIIWLSLIYMLVGTGSMLTLGRLGDTIGRKRLYTIGLIIFSLGLGLSSISRGFMQLLIFRAIMSMGSAMTVANGNAIVVDAFPPQERGKAIGIMSAIVGAGLLGGPAIGGILLDLFGWQAVFYLRLPIGIIAAIMAWFLLREPAVPGRSGKFDIPGAVAIFITLACLLLAVNRGQSLGWTSPYVFVLGGICIVSFIGFILIERRAEQPVVDLKLYRSRLFSAASASHVVTYLGSAGMNFLMPFLLIQGFGFSASKSGLLLVTIPGVYVFLAPISGRLSDRIGTMPLCTAGLAITATGIFLMRGLGASASDIDIIWRLLIVGIGMAIFASPNVSAVMGAVPKNRLGTASAMVATLRQIGMSTGMAIAGTIFTGSRLAEAARLTSQGLPEATVKSLSTLNGFYDAVLVATGFVIVSTIISALRGRQKATPESPGPETHQGGTR